MPIIYALIALYLLNKATDWLLDQSSIQTTLTSKEIQMKTFNDFDNYQEYVDYIKINDVATYNNLLELVDFTNRMTDNNYTVSDVTEDNELFYSWYEML